MKRPLLFALAGAAILFGTFGASLAMGFHPIDAATSIFSDSCDAPDASDAPAAVGAVDECGAADAETNDDGA